MLFSAQEPQSSAGGKRPPSKRSDPRIRNEKDARLHLSTRIVRLFARILAALTAGGFACAAFAAQPEADASQRRPDLARAERDVTVWGKDRPSFLLRSEAPDRLTSCDFHEGLAWKKGLRAIETDLVYACREIVARRASGMPLPEEMLALEAAMIEHRRLLRSYTLGRDPSGWVERRGLLRSVPDKLSDAALEATSLEAIVEILR